MTKKFKYFCLCAIIALAILFSLFSPILEGLEPPNAVAVGGYGETASIGTVYGKELDGDTNFAALDDPLPEVIELSWWESFMVWFAETFPFLFI